MTAWDKSKTVQCAEYIESRFKGQRYVYRRRRCLKRTTHHSGYCAAHRWSRPVTVKL